MQKEQCLLFRRYHGFGPQSYSGHLSAAPLNRLIFGVLKDVLTRVSLVGQYGGEMLLLETKEGEITQRSQT